MNLTLKNIFLQEEIVTNNKYNWKLHPVNGPKLWNLFKGMGNEALYFNPKGSTIEETDQDKKATGAWLPGATSKNHLIATDMQKKEIYATSLKDPRVATALISSVKYIPELLSYNVIIPIYGGEERNAGTLKDVLKKAKEIKGKSPSWQKGMFKSKDNEKYKEFKFEVLEDLSDHKWYHATSLQNLNSILSKGLLTSGEVEPGQGWTGFSVNLQDAVYLTASEDYALNIAETMLVKNGIPGVVLEISGDALKDKSKMVVDEDVLYNSFVEDFSYENIIDELPDYLISAISSRFSSVGYRDKIDKKFIKPIHVVDENKEENEVYIYSWEEWNKQNKKTLDEIISSYENFLEKNLKEVKKFNYKKGKGLRFTRYGGLSPIKQKNASAPTNKGLWAFIYPHFDWWFLSAEFSKIHGRFSKKTNKDGSLKHNKNLLKHFYHSGPIFTRFKVPNSIPYGNWYLTDTDSLAKEIPKLFSRDLRDLKRWFKDYKLTDVNQKNPYSYISIDHYEVFIPTQGSKYRDEEEIKRLQSKYNKTEKQHNDRDLEEFNAMGTGAVVGYGIPLGMKPDYDKLGTGKKNSKKKSKRWYEVNENTVPQGDPDARPLHGPTYFYPFGRSIPKNKRDNGGQSKARKWNKDGSLVDIKKLEKNSKSKEQWYENEIFEENNEVFLEILRQNSPWSVEDVKKTTRKRNKKNKPTKEINKDNYETIYYHGTNQEFKPGDVLQPPNITNNMSEKGRKKNLNKVFFTLDKGSAKIYAGRAVQSLGGKPHVYIVKPLEVPKWINKTKGTTILTAPTAEIIEEI